jgi:hypothetical protein
MPEFGKFIVFVAATAALNIQMKTVICELIVHT